MMSQTTQAFLDLRLNMGCVRSAVPDWDQDLNQFSWVGNQRKISQPGTSPEQPEFIRDYWRQTFLSYLQEHFHNCQGASY